LITRSSSATVNGRGSAGFGAGGTCDGAGDDAGGGDAGGDAAEGASAARSTRSTLASGALVVKSNESVVLSLVIVASVGLTPPRRGRYSVDVRDARADS
jgi:hypothetical protein